MLPELSLRLYLHDFFRMPGMLKSYSQVMLLLVLPAKADGFSSALVTVARFHTAPGAGLAKGPPGLEASSVTSTISPTT